MAEDEERNKMAMLFPRTRWWSTMAIFVVIVNKAFESRRLARPALGAVH